MADQPNSPNDPVTFREAISNWQLAARTEIKKASSLPSSVFDATDPMVEARLTETIDVMMQMLHRPSAEALRRHASGEHLEQRADQVTEDELRELPTKIPARLEHVDLEDHVTSEYLNLLIDACSTGTATTQQAARELLCQDFAVPANANLEDVTRALSECLQNTADSSCREGMELSRIEELCHAIAATVVINANDAESRKS